ncbi:hypothetical protein G7L40_20610 [Paenibacillus polymyxa]|uniref:hypothetical protein n=1 Tax=Paenibacillus polymyxa TaxID=1406 RepID=UPI0018C3EFA9|nr:hypothetical protein [Paenibacillus polymyxa]QPK59962.1 hypothetical protein G7L40_20610 [Paenibacillus polymyxa]
MADRGCTPELLRKLYEQGKPKNEIKKIFNIRDSKVLDRWFKESNIQARQNGSIYSFNKNYFDKIDSEDKAYWLGFIWCDGYVCSRVRNGICYYEFKLDLAEEDREHLEKLKISLEANYTIKKYKLKSNFDNAQDVVRLYISNKYFAGKLHNDYGLVANRHNTKKIVDKLPKHLIRHFIRGVLDADGSIMCGYVCDRSKKRLKARVQFTTYEEICTIIANYFVEVGITNHTPKLSIRNEGRDGYCRGLSYCGNEQVPKILNHLYDKSNTYLTRKIKNIYK